MRTRLGEEPAFPRPVASADYGKGARERDPHYSHPQDGMTTRVYLAGRAMEGLLADHIDHTEALISGETCPQAVARLAVEHADALLVELEKRK